MSEQKYGPSITIARLYERVSKSGNHYLVGRMGMAKIAILKSSEMTDDGVPIWNVVLQEAPKPEPRDGDADSRARPERKPTSSRRFDAEAVERQRTTMNDEIPF